MPTGTITISAYTANPPIQVDVNSSLEVRGWYSRDYISIDGVTPIFGNSTNGEQGPYYSTTPTLNGSGDVVVPAHDVQITVGANPTANYFEGLWLDEAFVMLLMPNTQGATGWQIPSVYGDPIAYDEIATYNRARRLVYAPDTYFTADQTIQEIERLAGNFDYMDVGVNGIGRASFPPVIASAPIVLMENDPRVGSWFNIIAYGATTTNTAAQNTVFVAAAITAATAAGGGIYWPAGFFPINTISITVPVLFAPGNSGPRPTTGQTVTFTKSISADLSKHFDNALSGQGTVSFTGNYVTKEVYSEWWGAIGDETTDCLAAINAAMAAFYLVRFLLAGYRVSGPISVPNRTSLYGPQVANTQTYARLIANGSLGFSGNNVVVVNASGQYNSFQNLAIYAKNISNASFVPFSITGLSETSFIKNIAVYIQNSSLSRMFFFDTFGPLIIETINIDIVDGTNSIANEPLYINAPAGVIFRDLNYHLPNIAAKGIKIITGLYGELSGLQIETHPTSASEPSLALTPAYGISLRDSRLNTSVVNSTGIKIMATQPTVDFAGYNLDNITIDPAGGGTWDKLVVLEDSLGATRSWSSANLDTNASSQLPQRIIRFTPSEQIFNGVQTSYGPHTFRDTFLFYDIITNGTIVIPFNPRVGTGTFGAGDILIAINGRVNVAGTSNSALIWMDYVDLAGGGITATFTWIVGTNLANWNASYAGGQITLTNKNANTMKETVVRFDHSTTELWPS